ncbi:MAG TPA: DUF1684 domain-containing protein [Dyadobacter sp.]|jgi:hypothetical protein|nr:DUF1684 domain-containing protein [Dyadobacter sp.]
MKKLLHLFLIAFGCTCPSMAQEFARHTDDYRDKYREEFTKTPNSPLSKDDLKYLQFYAPDSTYQVKASFERTRHNRPFGMPTYSGAQKTFVKYGVLRFKIDGRRQKLYVYRSLGLETLPQYKDYLFVPFKDRTSGKTTYGGGRYLDLKTAEIKDGSCLLDFNKAYNPYCAYSEGFNCPIPPKDNVLMISIAAGEKNFTKKH